MHVVITGIGNVCGDRTEDQSERSGEVAAVVVACRFMKLKIRWHNRFNPESHVCGPAAVVLLTKTSAGDGKRSCALATAPLLSVGGSMVPQTSSDWRSQGTSSEGALPNSTLSAAKSYRGIY